MIDEIQLGMTLRLDYAQYEDVPTTRFCIVHLLGDLYDGLPMDCSQTIFNCNHLIDTVSRLITTCTIDKRDELMENLELYKQELSEYLRVCLPSYIALCFAVYLAVQAGCVVSVDVLDMMRFLFVVLGLS
jgi:hypothetical protein